MWCDAGNLCLACMWSKVQEVDWSLSRAESTSLSTGDFWRNVGGNRFGNKISGWFGPKVLVFKKCRQT